jgi:hypothetical protein
MRAQHYQSSRTVSAALVILLAPALGVASVEPQEQHGSHTTSSGHLRVDVDGATNPERVSDYIAYRQLILAASHRDDASDVDRARRAAFIQRVGLSPKDEASLTAALRSVRERLDQLAAEKQELGAASPAAARATLREREEAVFDGANRRIRAFLSTDGWRRLDQFVQQQIKPNIKVYTSTSR